MKKTLIIISMVITGAASFADESFPKFSPLQLPAQTAANNPVHLDAAQRVIEGSPQPEYYNYGSYGNRNVYYPYGYVDTGRGKVYGPSGKCTNNYGN